MKLLKFLPSITVAACSFIFSACNSDEKKTDAVTVSTDSSVSKKSEISTKPQNVVIIKHRVANFAKWKAAYESHDSTRLAYGLHNYIISRGLKDSNMVMVALKMDDTAKAKQFGSMSDLKTAMHKGGVLGAPVILFLDVQMLDTSSNATTTRVIVTHKVKDWDAWKKTFDSHKQARVDAGLTDRAVSYSVGDTHTVTIVFAINDMTKAEAFMGSKDLKDKMQEAGVVGPPDIFFYNVVQKY